MYCLTTNDNHYEKIKKLGFLPVGLGKSIKKENFISDNTKINISEKTHFMENILFIIGYGKIKLTQIKKVGLDFVNIENSGQEKIIKVY